MVVFYNMTESEVKNYANFHLSIESSLSQISLLLIDKSTGKSIAIEHLKLISDSNIKQVLGSSEIVSKCTPSSVSCSIINSTFTLVPSSIFSENNIHQYLSLSTSESETDSIANIDNHQKNQAVTCYVIERNIRESLLSIFPNSIFKHISTILCDSVKDGLHINHSEEKSYEIVYKKNSKLIFCNRYTYENKDESLYFLSLIAEKLKLDLNKTNISLSGIVNKNGDMFSFWKQFIPEENLIFSEIETSQLNAVSRHQYFTLHKQFSCVL